MFSLMVLYAVPSFAQSQMADCVAKTSSIHVGMTRADIESLMVHDGGLSGMFKEERLYFTGPVSGGPFDIRQADQEVCMLNIDFRPYGIPDAIYNDANKFAQWGRANGLHPNPKDIVVKISVPFIDSPHVD
jgi:hypothetical protein